MRTVVKLPIVPTTPPEIVRIRDGLAAQLAMFSDRAVLSYVMSLPAAATCRPAVTRLEVMFTMPPGRPLPEPRLMRTICGVLVAVAVRVALLVGVLVTVLVGVLVTVGVSVIVAVFVAVAV